MGNRSKNGYVSNIEEETLTNTFFRKVLFTGSNLQLVVMTLQPGEDIGAEIHEEHDQFFRIEEGEATVTIDNEEFVIHEDEVAIVPAGKKHNLSNKSTSNVVKLYTIYAPPEHPNDRVDEKKPV